MSCRGGGRRRPVNPFVHLISINTLFKIFMHSIKNMQLNCTGSKSDSYRGKMPSTATDSSFHLTYLMVLHPTMCGNTLTVIVGGSIYCFAVNN